MGENKKSVKIHKSDDTDPLDFFSFEVLDDDSIDFSLFDFEIIDDDTDE